MEIHKRTYSIEERTLRAFESSVESGRRSEVINALLQKFLIEREKDEIRAQLIAGAPIVEQLYREETEAWYPLEEEVYEKSEAKSTSSRRGDPSKLRSNKGS